MAFFELVNTSSCNRVGDYDTEEEALREVRELVERHGPSAAANLALGSIDELGHGELFAEGGVLVTRAFATAGTTS